MYLSNVETLARKFVEEKHDALAALRADDGGFLAFWASLEPRRRRQMAAVSGEVILKVRSRAGCAAEDERCQCPKLCHRCCP